MKLVFLLIDALKSNYLTQENMPFLYKLSKEGKYVKQIIPCPGFCERSEIFSGLDGYDTGNFTAIGYMPEKSPYVNDSIILNLFSLIGHNRISQKLFPIWRIRTQKRLNNYRIPFKSLKNFALTEDGKEKLIDHSDIFDQITSEGKTYTMDAFTSLSDLSPRYIGSPIGFIKDNIAKQVDFIPYYIGIIDAVGHKYGSDIASIRPYLIEVDNTIKSIYKLAKADGYAIAVLGDHGMVPVEAKIDIMAKVKALNVKLHRDYEAFYDSTSVRFWFNNKKSKDLIQKLFYQELSDYGTIINENNCTDYRIPLDVCSSSGKPIYGELLWCANPGVLISPDYFHSTQTSENGMHGYIKVIEGEGTGLFVAVGDKVPKSFIEREHSSKVCRELCNILEIKTPNSEWKRILK